MKITLQLICWLVALACFALKGVNFTAGRIDFFAFGWFLVLLGFML